MSSEYHCHQQVHPAFEQDSRNRTPNEPHSEDDLDRIDENREYKFLSDDSDCYEQISYNFGAVYEQHLSDGEQGATEEEDTVYAASSSSEQV